MSSWGSLDDAAEAVDSFPSFGVHSPVSPAIPNGSAGHFRLVTPMTPIQDTNSSASTRLLAKYPSTKPYQTHHQVDATGSRSVDYRYDVATPEIETALNTYTSTTSTKLPWTSKATILSSICNLCNANIGIGLLCLPYTAVRIGWLGSVIMIISCAVISAFTFHLQSSAAIMFNNNAHSISSAYHTLSHRIWSSLSTISDIIVILQSIGGSVAYLIIIGDLLPDAIVYIFQEVHISINSKWIDRRFWICSLMLCIIAPSMVLRKLNSLRFTSSLSIICCLAFSVVMAFYLFDDEVNLCRNNLSENECGIIPFPDLLELSHDDLMDILGVIPIYLFVFSSHSLSFELSNELLNSTYSRMNMVICGSFGFITVFYIIVILIGYFTFGDEIRFNMLINYPSGNVLICAVRIGLSIVMAFGYSVVSIPGRHCLSSLLFNENVEKLSRVKSTGISIGIIGCSVGIAVFVDDLELVVKWIGSSLSPVVMFVLPSLFYYQMERTVDCSPVNDKVWLCSWCNLCCSLLCGCFGICFIMICISLIFWR